MPRRVVPVLLDTAVSATRLRYWRLVTTSTDNITTRMNIAAESVPTGLSSAKRGVSFNRSRHRRIHRARQTIRPHSSSYLGWNSKTIPKR